MTRTYWECIDDNGQPATARQTRLLGTIDYGYRTRMRAELSCPSGRSVRERFTDGSDDWSGRVVSCRLADGTLVRLD